MPYNPPVSDTTQNPILVKGVGTPFVSLFDNDMKPIINPSTGIYLGAYISSFKMVFQERSNEEDLGNHVEFVFETGDPSAVDLPTIQKDSVINFQYGYIYPNASAVCGPLISTVVYGLSLVLDTTGTHITITGTEVGLKLRFIGPFRGNGKSFKEFLDEGCGINMPIVIKKFSEV